MTGKKETPKSVEIEILEIQQGQFTVGIVGTTPLLMHRFSDKARRELTLPAPKMNAAAKATNLKHHPIQEAQGCAHLISDEIAPTFFGCPSLMFKNAIAAAALDIPGTTKAAIGRLVYIVGEYPGELIPIWGQPFLHAAMVRNSDINRTPDVRFRLVFPKWAMRVTVKFIQPNLSAKGVYNLLAASGLITGIGDWRQGKGKGSYGSFRLCDIDDPDLLVLKQPGERERQKAAFENLAAYDDETRELLEWYDSELLRRGREQQHVPSTKRKRTGNGANGEQAEIVQ